MLGSAWTEALSYSVVKNNFQSIPTYVKIIPKHHGQTDRQTTYCGITALCGASTVKISLYVVLTMERQQKAVAYGSRFYPGKITAYQGEMHKRVINFLACYAIVRFGSSSNHRWYHTTVIANRASGHTLNFIGRKLIIAVETIKPRCRKESSRCCDNSNFRGGLRKTHAFWNSVRYLSLPLERVTRT